MVLTAFTFTFTAKESEAGETARVCTTHCLPRTKIEIRPDTKKQHNEGEGSPCVCYVIHGW